MQDSGIWEPSACQPVDPRARDPMPIAASVLLPTPQAESPLPENREHRAIVVQAWFAATPPSPP